MFYEKMVISLSKIKFFKKYLKYILQTTESC